MTLAEDPVQPTSDAVSPEPAGEQHDTIDATAQPDRIAVAPHERRDRIARRVLRVAAIAAAIAAVVLLVSVAAAALLLNGRARLDPAEAALLSKVLAPAPEGGARTVLLVGVDHVNRGGRRADTVILARIDPASRRAWLLSVPRDTNVGGLSRIATDSCSPAPACSSALKQATVRWPKRDRATDGVCASAAHNRQNPNSDHRWGNAFDLTNDPAHGVDCATIAEGLRRSRDPRIAYVIFAGRIAGPDSQWMWRDYSGPDAHTGHIHVSVLPSARRDTGPWPGIAFDVAPTPVQDARGWFAALTAPAATASTATVPMLQPNADGGMKINKAYAIGGPALLVQTVEELTGTPVNDYVETDFQGVRDVVDAFGGVWVDVPERIDDYKAANASPKSKARHVASGRQLLDGDHALTFVRSRAYWDGDFSRMQNQRAFLKALAARAASPEGVIRIPAALSAIARSTRTDMSTADLLGVGASALVAGTGAVESASVPGVWKSPYVRVNVPRTDDMVAAMIAGKAFMPWPGDVTVSVANGTPSKGLALRVARDLARRGFTVKGIGNADTTTYDKTMIIAKQADQAAAERVLGVMPVGEYVSVADHDPRMVTRVVIILGRDAEQALTNGN